MCPFGLAGLVGYWWVQKANRTRTLGTGRIRLPDSSNRLYRADSELAQNLASVPRFVLGLASAAFARVSEVAGELPFLRGRLGRSRGSYGGYRQVYADEDASMLPDFEEDELDR